MAVNADLKIYRQSSPNDKYVKTAGGILVDTDAPTGGGGGGGSVATMSDNDLINYWTSAGAKATASSSYVSTPPMVLWLPGAAASGGWITNGTATGWNKIEFPVAVIMKSYAIAPWSPDTFPGRTPKTWTLEGSNDDVTYTVLDTRTNYTTWTRWSREMFTTTNTTAYKFYKINVTANQGDGYMGMSGLWLYGPAPVSAASPASALWNMASISTDPSVQATRTIDFSDPAASIASYTWANQGTATAAIQRNRLYMTSVNNGSQVSSRRLLRPPVGNQLPASPWCLQVALTLYAKDAYNLGGVYIRNTANANKAISTQIIYRADIGRTYAFHSTTMTAENAGVADLGPNGAAESKGVIAVTYDGATFGFWYSPDGQDWGPEANFTQAASAFIGSAGTYDWAFMVDSNQANKSAAAFNNAIILNQATPVPHGQFV